MNEITDIFCRSMRIGAISTKIGGTLYMMYGLAALATSYTMDIKGNNCTGNSGYEQCVSRYEEDIWRVKDSSFGPLVGGIVFFGIGSLVAQTLRGQKN